MFGILKIYILIISYMSIKLKKNLNAHFQKEGKEDRKRKEKRIRKKRTKGYPYPGRIVEVVGNTF